MNNNKEKMVEVARFQFPADAYTLISLLESEGIDCYLRNEKTASLLSYMDVGGARVEILESNLPKAIKVMKDGGYDIEGNKKAVDTSGKGSFLDQIPLIKTLPFPLQIILYIILILILIFAALVI